MIYSGIYAGGSGQNHVANLIPLTVDPTQLFGSLLVPIPFMKTILNAVCLEQDCNERKVVWITSAQILRTPRIIRMNEDTNHLPSRCSHIGRNTSLYEWAHGSSIVHGFIPKAEPQDSCTLRGVGQMVWHKSGPSFIRRRGACANSHRSLTQHGRSG